MAETGSSDLGTGLVLTFSIIGALGAIAMASSSFLSFANHDDTMQLLSGVFLTVALLASGIAVAAVHLYD
jgi:hypothetical protein